MIWRGKLLRNLWASAWYTFAVAIVLLATVFSAARLLLPYTSHYNAELGAEISRQLGQPVKIGTLEAEWRGWTPALVLNDISLLDEKTGATIFQLGKVRLGLDLMGSLVNLQPVFSRITLVGVDLQLTRGMDQRISVTGLKTSGKGDANLDSLAAWMLSQGWIQLENSGVTWRDLSAQGRLLHFSSVNISLRNATRRHLLDASVVLPGKQAGSLSLHVDLRGDLINVEDREIAFYLEGRQLRFREFLEEQPVGNLLVSAEKADFKVWGNLEKDRLRNLQGDVDAAGISLTALESEPVQFGRIAGKFSWQKIERGGKLEAKDLLVVPVGFTPRPARLSLHYYVHQDAPISINLRAANFQLESFTPFSTLLGKTSQKLQQAITALAPRGDVNSAELHWQGGESPDFRLYAYLQDAAVNAWQQVPAAQDVDGKLWLHNKQGQLALENAVLNYEYPRFFRGPIPVDRLRGEMAWELTGSQWWFAGRNLEASNQDISARVSLDVLGDKTRRRPFVSILGEFRDGDGSQLSRYLPAKIMRPKTVKWLDEGIVSGKAVSGDVVIHGDLHHFPFGNGDGRFEVNIKVADGSLNYREGWPMIHDIDADVQFLGRSMTVNAGAGRVFSNRIQNASVHIADVKKKPLLVNVRGEASGSTQDKLDYLAASPVLSKIFGRSVERMSARGDSILQLELNLPVGVKNGVRINGHLAMQDNALMLEPVGQVLDGTSGELMFTQDGVTAKSIKTRLMGQPSVLVVSTEKTPQSRNIYLRSRGPYNAKGVVSRILPGLEKYFSGNGLWDVSLVIPLRSKKPSPNVPTLRAVTDLQGVIVKLPAPMGKSADVARNLVLNLDFPRDQASVLRVGYHDVLDSVFALASEGGADLERGEIRFTQGAAILPNAQGLRVTGILEEFSLDDWRKIWESEPESSKRDVAQPVQFNFAALKDVRIQAGKFTAYGMPFHALQLQLAAEPNGWMVNLDSKEIKGHVRVPKDMRRFPLEAKLSHWYLALPEIATADKDSTVDPRDIPALNITAGDFRYKDRRFGKLTLNASRQLQGLRLDQLRVEPESTSISLQGGWYVRGKSQHSNISLQLESADIGNTLTSLGYVGAIDEGKGALDVELQWPSSLIDVDLANMQGQVKMDVKDGHLLDVDPGAGRMFGLLSLQMLPRRLSLDFSDVFKKGFGFDQIAGSFNIVDGNAHTEDFYMDGPSARVDISGRVGLVDEDYNQTITVTPKVSGTLPVIGALAAAPQVGALILLAQKLFKPKIDEATRHHYSITGPWQEPVIERIKNVSLPPQDNSTGAQ